MLGPIALEVVHGTFEFIILGELLKVGTDKATVRICMAMYVGVAYNTCFQCQ